MKTPKRNYEKMKIVAGEVPWGQISFARWKRKNRITQYKRTIARLTDELTAERRQLNALWLGDHLKRFSPEWDAFMQLRRLKTPAEDAALDEKFEYWVALREVGKSVLNAACLAAMAYGEAKGKEEEKSSACHPETAKNGQQPDLPPTGGQQDRKGQDNG